MSRHSTFTIFICMVILTGCSICDTSDNSSNGSFPHDFYEHLQHHMTIEKTNESTKVTQPEESEYLPYFSGIVKSVLQMAWNKHHINIITHLNCSSESITQLVSIFLKYKVEVNCYRLKQIDVYAVKYLLEFIQGDVIILLLPWYYTEGLLERFAHFGIDGSPYITLEISQPFIRRIREINSHIKVSNIITVKSDEPGCETITPSNFPLLRKISIPESQHQQVTICDSLKTKPLRITTVLYGKDILTDLVPAVYPVQNICTVGLPCRKSEKVKETIAWKWFCCHGIYIDFVQLIINYLQTDFEIYIVEDNQFGSKINGEWSGMIKDIISDKADLGAHFFNVLPTRFHVVDFTSSVSKETDGYGLIKRKFDRKYLTINWTFISSIDQKLLIVSIAVTFVAAISLICLERLILSHRDGIRYPSREGMSHVSGIFLQRDLGGSVSKTWSGQTFSIVFAFGMTIFISSYTAKLTASGVAKETDSFKVFKDERLKNPSYKVAMRKGTANAIYYNRLKGLKAEKVYVEKPPFRRLLNGEIDFYVCSPYYARITINKNKEYFEQLKVYKDDSYQIDYAFAYEKGSIIGQKISNYLLRIKEEGIMADIIDKWTITKDDRVINQQFPWEYMGGMILVIGIFVGVCVLILLAENLYTYVKLKRRRVVEGNEGSRRDKPCCSKHDLTFYG